MHKVMFLKPSLKLSIWTRSYNYIKMVILLTIREISIKNADAAFAHEIVKNILKLYYWLEEGKCREISLITNSLNIRCYNPPGE